MLPTFIQQSLSHESLVLLDIGAAGGLRPVWRRARSIIYSVGFEPDPVAFQLLKDRQEYSLILPFALSDKTGNGNFYVTRSKGRSSLLKPNLRIIGKFYDTAQFEITNTVAVQTTTLDEVLTSHNLRQGGVKATLPAALGVEIETEFLPRYEGQALFEDVHRLLTQNGFVLFGLQPRNFTRTSGRRYGWQRGQPLYTYALYFRELGPSPERIVVLKLAALAWLYGYFDYAEEVFASYRHLFSSEESAVFAAALARTIPFQRRLRFPGRYHLATWFWQLWRRWVVRPQWRT